MVGTRSAQVPFEYVMAELAAAPFALRGGLKLALTELDPLMEARDSARLWRQTENMLLPHLSAYSVDELTSLRDWLWFGDDRTGRPGPVPLGEFLSRFADNTLIFSGDSFRPRRPEWCESWTDAADLSDDPLARRYWRWISFSLPTDLLIAAHPRSVNAASKVDLISPSLRQMLLDERYVEPHLHLGAALDFPLLWISLQHALVDEGLDSGAFAGPGAEFGDGRGMGFWLQRAGIARYVLAAFLCWKRRSLLDGRIFHAFLETEVEANLSGSAVEIARRCFGLLAAGGTLRTKGAQEDFSALRQLYEYLARIRYRWPDFPEHLLQAMQADPIASFFPITGLSQPSSETQFVRAALDYLKSPDGMKDRGFAETFWQVVRIRCIFYRHVVQRPQTPGLQWFIRFYSRLSVPRKPISVGLLVESAAVVCGKDLGLRSLEVRLKPEADPPLLERALRLITSTFHAIRREKDQLADNDRNINQTCEFGIILHFAKAREGGARQGLPKANAISSNGDPSLPANLSFRYGAYYIQRRKEALALADLIKRYPRCLYYVRAIDVCTDELGVPNWVLAPLVRYLKDLSREASGFLLDRDRTRVPPLRVTAHAGEDFLHLLGGLRRTDETIEHLQLSQGDRLGHAIALGINPVEWATQTRGVALSRMERLMDLAWEWKFTMQHSIPLPANRLQFVLDEIERLSRLIFGTPYRPTQVVDFMALLHDPDELRRVGFPSGPIPDMRDYIGCRYNEFGSRGGRERWGASGSAEYGRETPSRRTSDLMRSGDEPLTLLYRYLIEPETFRQGQVHMLIDLSKEVDVLDEIQRALRRKVGRMGIVVEINPSSNLLIGNMADLSNHPLWRLNPPRGDPDLPPISVCIGSDDPITFSTSTREEYQTVYDTLVLAGLSDSAAKSWIDDARSVGVNCRFTLEHDQEHEFIWQAMTGGVVGPMLPP